MGLSCLADKWQKGQFWSPLLSDWCHVGCRSDSISGDEWPKTKWYRDPKPDAIGPTGWRPFGVGPVADKWVPQSRHETPSVSSGSCSKKLWQASRYYHEDFELTVIVNRHLIDAPSLNKTVCENFCANYSEPAVIPPCRNRIFETIVTVPLIMNPQRLRWTTIFWRREGCFIRIAILVLENYPELTVVSISWEFVWSGTTPFETNCLPRVLKVSTVIAALHVWEK